MLKTVFTFFCLAISCLASAQNFDPHKVMPATLTGYDFGMTLDLFKAKNKTATILPDESYDFRIEAKETEPGGDFNSITYYFDKEDNKPLYEIIVEFKTEELQLTYISKYLKAPNFEDKWKWKTKDGYTFKAWGFGKKLVFVLALPKTEWDESKN